MKDLINEQPEQDIEHCETCIHSTDSDDICILRKCKYAIAELIDCYEPKQPERMTNRQWIDFLSAQFDISRTSAKEMLHRMMQGLIDEQPTVNTARHGQEDTDMKTDLYLVNISYIKAIDIIENSNESTDEQIMISAIYKILRMETTNAVTKDVLKKAVNYLFNKMYSIED